MSDTVPFPSLDHLWSVEEQMLVVQQIAFQFFADCDWVWAGKMMGRLERLSRRLDAGRNPFHEAGRALLRRRRPANAPPPPPKPEPKPEPESLPPLSEAEILAHFEAMIADVNEMRAKAEVPALTWEQALAWVAEKHGQADADFIAAAHARRAAAPPSG